MSSSVPSLFQPIRVGTVDLQHRVVMAPVTRHRENKDHVHGELAKTYYTQRSGVPGTLMITEATFIAPQAGGYGNIPGIWSDAQIAAWKSVCVFPRPTRITDAVHANGSYIFLQLWALGRAADPDVLKQEGDFDLVGPSPNPVKYNVPRELTVAEIKEYVQLYSKAASNAIEAGFDGVEIHAANGYILDQFLQTVSNERTDEYGGSVENRVRFPLEVIKAVVETVGVEDGSMGMKDPLPTFTTFVERIRDEHTDLAYLHVIEPRASGDAGIVTLSDENRAQSNEVLRKVWGDRPYIAAGGINRATAIDTVSKYGGLIAFGRHFIANPDLPLRLKEGLPLTHYNRGTFFTPESAAGYIDYPFANNAVIVQAQ
ncbi:putative NADPH2 dehydrogenase chain OYE2 [Lactarius akahatsu]|uniref:NADPH2 dehydrogenase chain OYE2 n=1 Tax=Lactarius akahatsu TaxID=416441 RepID=A0AAD4LHK6_9AGAM|nr:putative NADPH2 dehydrogenase chain OYE2 [Lactarius akahatsu]